MSAMVADSVRSRLETSGYSQSIVWRSHGNYSLKGFDKALEIVEAGLEGVASFAEPVASDKANAATPAASAAVTGGRRWGLVVLALTIGIAIAAARVAVQIGSQYAEAHGTLGRVYADAGEPAEAEKVLAQLRERQDIYVAPHFVAVILIGLGRSDEALDELAKADKQRSWPVMGWKVDPDLDPLRTDPRFTALLKQVGPE